jgi:hypothetical protein
MNDKMIEATSRFEIPRPILRSSVWPRRPVRRRARARPARCASGAVSLDTACNTVTVVLAISW